MGHGAAGQGYPEGIGFEIVGAAELVIEKGAEKSHGVSSGVEYQAAIGVQK